MNHYVSLKTYKIVGLIKSFRIFGTMSEGGSICGSNIPNFVGNSNDCFKYDSKEKYENNPFQCGTAVKVDVPRGSFDNNTFNCMLDQFRDWSS